MSLIFDTQIEDIIKMRTSVRTYSDKAIPEDVKLSINDYIGKLSNPFNSKVSFKILQSDEANNSSKLGTYGFIKGAKNYIGSTVVEGSFDLEGLGYEFEKLILYITSLGLGTCWLGGTFKRNEFAKAMSINERDLFPAISPFGYAADKKSITDSLIRSIAKSDTRKPWEELFFNETFDKPLLPSDPNIFADILEMVRLAPSASNKQPWRIVKDKNTYHFYEYKVPSYSKAFEYDIQRIDMGIAACHFHLTAIEKGIVGKFEALSNPINDTPIDTFYKFSWISE